MSNPTAPLSRDFPRDGKKYYRLPGSSDHAQVGGSIPPDAAPHQIKLPQQSFQKPVSSFELAKREPPQ